MKVHLKIIYKLRFQDRYLWKLTSVTDAENLNILFSRSCNLCISLKKMKFIEFLRIYWKATVNHKSEKNLKNGKKCVEFMHWYNHWNKWLCQMIIY